MHGGLFLGLGELGQYKLGALQRDLHERRIALKVITGYQFDNDHQYVTDIYGNPYAFHVTHDDFKQGSPMWDAAKKEWPDFMILDRVYSFHVWDFTGNHSIYGGHFRVKHHDIVEATIPAGVIADAEAAMMDWFDGKVTCADCGQKTKAHEGRTYFAGTYCKGCWEGTSGKNKGAGGYKAVEAREKYN